jgi:trigger factor
LAAQGMDTKDLKLDWNKVKESQKDKATRDVKASLLLDKIAEREAIGATQEEVDREVQRIARQQREAVAVTRAKLQKEGAIAKIAANIRTEKTLTMLFEQARKEAAQPIESAEEPAEPEEPA